MKDKFIKCYLGWRQKSKIKSIFLVLTLITLISICVFKVSYAYLHKEIDTGIRIDFKAGTLSYTLESSNLKDNIVTVPLRTSKQITITVTSNNKIDSKYELYYNLLTSLTDEERKNIEIGYLDNTENSVSGTVNANETLAIRVKVINKLDKDIEIKFGVQGGLPKADFALTDGSRIDKKLKYIDKLQTRVSAENLLRTTGPTLTTNSEEANENGLYKSTETNSGNPTYFFRGNVKNNYVSFAGFTWRIVRINEDGTIRLIMEEGINNNSDYSYNDTWDASSQDFSYYSSSEAKKTLDAWYKTNLEKYNQIETGNYFCESNNVKSSESYNANEFTQQLEAESQYIPSFKCSTDINNRNYVNSGIGLMTYDELIYAGARHDKSSKTTYLFNNSGHGWWSMSGTGLRWGGYGAWFLEEKYGVLYDGNLPDLHTLRPVINLKSETLVTGVGTSDDSYIVQ